MKASDGSIINRGKDRQGRTIWEVSVSLGRDPATGKHLRKCRRIHGTKADARKACDDMRRDLEGGLRIDADQVTFSEFSRQWLERREQCGEFSRNTLKRDAETTRIM